MATNIKHTIGIYFCIVTDLPKVEMKAGTLVPVLSDEGQQIMETNYFCQVLTDPKTGVEFIEWDIDSRFAQRFANEQGAVNFHRVVLKDMERTFVVLHPGCIKNTPILPNKKLFKHLINNNLKNEK